MVSLFCLHKVALYLMYSCRKLTFKGCIFSNPIRCLVCGRANSRTVFGSSPGFRWKWYRKKPESSPGPGPDKKASLGFSFYQKPPGDQLCNPPPPKDAKYLCRWPWLSDWLSFGYFKGQGRKAQWKESSFTFPVCLRQMPNLKMGQALPLNYKLIGSFLPFNSWLLGPWP